MLWTEDQVLQLLDVYIELTEKQEETIQKMGQIIKRQATELANLRNVREAEPVVLEGDHGLLD